MPLRSRSSPRLVPIQISPADVSSIALTLRGSSGLRLNGMTVAAGPTPHRRALPVPRQSVPVGPMYSLLTLPRKPRRVRDALEQRPQQPPLSGSGRPGRPSVDTAIIGEHEVVALPGLEST